MKKLLDFILFLFRGLAKKPSPAAGYLSEHFTADEFRCKCCGTLPADKQPPEQLLKWLETIRAEMGDLPVTINSGYRCPKHNKAVGGAPNSLHLRGQAADFRIKSVPNKEIQTYADTLIGEDGGVGRYRLFTHIDNRGYKARW